jgi:hypothetical protein
VFGQLIGCDSRSLLLTNNNESPARCRGVIGLIGDLIGSAIETLRLVISADLLTAMLPVLIPLVPLASLAVATLQDSQACSLFYEHTAGVNRTGPRAVLFVDAAVFQSDWPPDERAMTIVFSHPPSYPHPHLH